MHKGENKKVKRNIVTRINLSEKKKSGSSFIKEDKYESKTNIVPQSGIEYNKNGSNGKEKANGNKKEKKIYLRKEIFDAAIIYTTNKMEESALLQYLRNFYEYVSKKKKKNSKYLNEELFVNFEEWSNYNELINNQDNILGTIFNVAICKALWILLIITIHSVRKRNNVNKQKTIFNTSIEKLISAIHSGNDNSNSANFNNRYNVEKSKREVNKEDIRKEQLLSKYDKFAQKKKEETKENKSDYALWNDNWQNEAIIIELVIFFIILQFHKIDNARKKIERSISEDCWPNYMDSPRSVGSSSFTNMTNLNNLANSFNRQNLSDFFNNSISGNCKHFLKSFLITFLSSTDIINNNNLSEMPLYFKNENFYLLDFIIDTNDETNVYQTFLRNNEYKVLYKTKDILNWLLDSLCIQEEISNYNISCQYMSSLNASMSSESDMEHFFLNIGIEQVRKEVYEIKNSQGKAIYINDEKQIIHIDSCKDCNIFIFCKADYLKINACVDCYIICLAVEMITTLFNSTNIDFHLVTRNLKIENAIDCSIFIYTETNIIISGDTRNIQLAPYNILNPKQQSCLEKSFIFFNEENCKLFAFPLNCKTNFSSSSLNLSGVLKASSNKCTTISDKSGLDQNKTLFLFKNQGNDKKGSSTNKMRECSNTNNNMLSGSITDYVYYLVNPANFCLIEFSDDISAEGEEHNIEQKKTNQCKIEGNFNNLLKNTCQKEKQLKRNDKKNKSSNTTSLNEKKKNDLKSSANTISNPHEVYANSKQKNTYVCLFLPEVYKNAIENQDERIISFLNFMNNIKLTRNQKQKLTKILTFKLYEFIKKNPKTLRVLNDLTMKEQEKSLNLEWNGSHF